MSNGCTVVPLMDAIDSGPLRTAPQTSRMTTLRSSRGPKPTLNQPMKTKLDTWAVKSPPVPVRQDSSKPATSPYEAKSTWKERATWRRKPSRGRTAARAPTGAIAARTRRRLPPTGIRVRLCKWEIRAGSWRGTDGDRLRFATTWTEQALAIDRIERHPSSFKTLMTR